MNSSTLSIATSTSTSSPSPVLIVGATVPKNSPSKNTTKDDDRTFTASFTKQSYEDGVGISTEDFEEEESEGVQDEKIQAKLMTIIPLAESRVGTVRCLFGRIQVSPSPRSSKSLSPTSPIISNALLKKMPDGIPLQDNGVVFRNPKLNLKRTSSSAPPLGFRAFESQPFLSLGKSRLESMNPMELQVPSMDESAAIAILGGDQRFFVSDESRLIKSDPWVYLSASTSRRRDRLTLLKGMEIVIYSKDGRKELGRIRVADITNGGLSTAPSSTSSSVNGDDPKSSPGKSKENLRKQIDRSKFSSSQDNEVIVSLDDDDASSLQKSASFSDAEDKLRTSPIDTRRKHFQIPGTISSSQDSEFHNGRAKAHSGDTQDSKSDCGDDSGAKLISPRSAMKKSSDGGVVVLKKKISWSAHSQDIVSGENLSELSDSEDGEGVIPVLEKPGGSPISTADKGRGIGSTPPLITIDGISISAELHVEIPGLERKIVRIGGLLGHRAEVASCATIGSDPSSTIYIKNDNETGEGSEEVYAAVCRVGHSFHLVTRANSKINEIGPVSIWIGLPLHHNPYPIQGGDVLEVVCNSGDHSKSFLISLDIKSPDTSKTKIGNMHQELSAIHLEVTSQVRKARFSGLSAHTPAATGAFSIKPGARIELGKSLACAVSIHDTKLGRKQVSMSRQRIAGRPAYFIETFDDKKPTYLLLGKGDSYQRSLFKLSADDVFKAGRSEFRAVYLRSGSRQNSKKLASPSPSPSTTPLLSRPTLSMEINQRTISATQTLLKTQPASADGTPKLIPLAEDGLLDYFGLTSHEGPMLILLCVKGPYQRRFFLANPIETTIGSSPQCNTSIRSDKALSSMHCRIFFDENDSTWRLEDLNSTNGTWLRLKPEVPLMICAGDIFQMGRTTVKSTGVVFKSSKRAGCLLM